MNKPRRVRIYKLSTFDTFTEEERALNEAYKKAKDGCNSGKYLAYKGLPLSSSIVPEEYEIDIDKCLVVPDFSTMVNEKVECIDIDHKKREFIGIERRNEDVEIPQTDGAGMFLPGVLPASAQIRCSHLKGAIFPFDFRKFLGQDEVETDYLALTFQNYHMMTQKLLLISI